MSGYRVTSYTADQHDWLTSNNLFIGDIVFVVNTDEKGENNWPVEWNPIMDKALGRSYKIRGVCDSGIELDISTACGDSRPLVLVFPYFVLATSLDEERYKKEQERWLHRNNIQKGDIVRVTHRAHPQLLIAGCSSWVSSMEATIGRTFEIAVIHKDGIKLCTSKEDFKHDYWFPYYVLEKVTQNSTQETICEGENKTMEKTLKKTKQQALTAAQRVSLTKTINTLVAHICQQLPEGQITEFVESDLGGAVVPVLLLKIGEILTEDQSDKKMRRLNELCGLGSEEYLRRLIEKIIPDVSTLSYIAGLAAIEILDNDE